MAEHKAIAYQCTMNKDAQFHVGALRKARACPEPDSELELGPSLARAWPELGPSPTRSLRCQVACDTRTSVHKGIWGRDEHNAARELTACGGEWRYRPRIELHIRVDSASSKPAVTPGFCSWAAIQRSDPASLCTPGSTDAPSCESRSRCRRSLGSSDGSDRASRLQTRRTACSTVAAVRAHRLCRVAVHSSQAPRRRRRALEHSSQAPRQRHRAPGPSPARVVAARNPKAPPRQQLTRSHMGLLSPGCRKTPRQNLLIRPSQARWQPPMVAPRPL